MRIAAFLIALTLAQPAVAAGDASHPQKIKWSFDGVTGTFDKPAIQRGFQVYREVCASCHSLKRVAYRNLMDIGFTEDEVKAIAAEKTLIDGVDDAGDPLERAGRPSDRFIPPYPNEKAARASNGGAYPPDLSLIVKARHDGANYLYSLLTGYHDAPAEVQLNPGMSYNPFFPGGQIAMPAPLVEGGVEYIDETEATVEQQAKDVVNFLQWAAEPEMEARKGLGVRVFIFLIFFTLLFYQAKKLIWSRVNKDEA